MILSKAKLTTADADAVMIFPIDFRMVTVPEAENASVRETALRILTDPTAVIAMTTTLPRARETVVIPDAAIETFLPALLRTFAVPVAVKLRAVAMALRTENVPVPDGLTVLPIPLGP